MDVKQAVALAKTHIADLFSGEGMVNLGLEEVEFDDAREQWRITLGFSRAWDRQSGLAALANGGMGRTFKVVTVDKDGKAVSVKNRETANAG